MVAVTYTTELLLAFLLVAVSAAALLARYGHRPFTGALEKVVASRVAERTRELETLHENQRRMLLDLSHNLQTPLSVLKARIETFERTMLHDGHMEGLVRSVDSVAHFVNELLAHANLEHALRLEERRNFPLSELVEDLVTEMSVPAETSGIQIVSAVAPDIMFFGNEKRIREALMNLVCNALKYMGEGPTRRVRVSLEVKGGQILAEVTDTGRGIPENELPRIFERFYRGSACEYGTPGTGLGLAIVERIAQEHDGVITVTSDLDKGSAFTLILPRESSGYSRTSRS